MAVVAGIVSAAGVGLELLTAAHVQAQDLSATLQTTVTVTAFVTAGLLFVRFDHTRRLRELLLLGVVVIVALVGLAASALPTLVPWGALEAGNGVHIAMQLLVALGFAAVAGAPPGRLVVGRRPPAIVIGAAALIAVGLSVAAAVTSSAHNAAKPAAGGHPLLVVVTLLEAGALLLAAVVFLRRARAGDGDSWLLGVAALLLGAAGLEYFALPNAGADWITPMSALRVAAWAALLATAITLHSKSRQASAEAALQAERQRIARDLHDGLAQDLAFIASHGSRLAREYGAEHPLAIAANRALAASRGAMVDLAASTAPSTAAAIERVADELEARFGVQVHVGVDGNAVNPDRDLAVPERDELVRIAREAIVNAVQHGRARHVTVELGSRRADVLLRVRDDGCGIGRHATDPSFGRGFGVPAMRARAASLGGHLVARRRAGGGTEVTVLAS